MELGRTSKSILQYSVLPIILLLTYVLLVVGPPGSYYFILPVTLSIVFILAKGWSENSGAGQRKLYMYAVIYSGAAALVVASWLQELRSPISLSQIVVDGIRICPWLVIPAILGVWYGVRQRASRESI